MVSLDIRHLFNKCNKCMSIKIYSALHDELCLFVHYLPQTHTHTQRFTSNWRIDPPAQRTSCWARERTGRVFGGWRGPRVGGLCPWSRVNTAPARGLSDSRILLFCWSKNLKRLSGAQASRISPPFSFLETDLWSAHPRPRCGCCPGGSTWASSACGRSTSFG